MGRLTPKPRFDFGLFLKKTAISGFVVLSFIAYVVDQRLGAARQPALTSNPTIASNAASKVFSQAVQTSPLGQVQVQQPANTSPTIQPTATRVPGNMYRDGVFKGQEADALYGLVQVQVTVQGGKLTDVTALEYPQDRRTSRMINSQAIPWLTSEVVQAQTARVNMISGATLTSYAFMQSLQSALTNAKG